jgi:hypothetical protein
VVSAVGDLLELLYTARAHWTTVQATIRQWTHLERSHLAYQRHLRETCGVGGEIALIEEPRRRWDDPVILIAFFGGLAILTGFLWWERRADHPMLPVRLFSRRNVTFANIETLTVYAGLSTLAFFLVLVLQQLAGYSARRSGMALLPVIAAPLTGSANELDVTGYHLSLLVTAALVAAGGAIGLLGIRNAT